MVLQSFHVIIISFVYMYFLRVTTLIVQRFLYNIYLIGVIYIYINLPNDKGYKLLFKFYFHTTLGKNDVGANIYSQIYDVVINSTAF